MQVKWFYIQTCVCLFMYCNLAAQKFKFEDLHLQLDSILSYTLPVKMRTEINKGLKFVKGINHSSLLFKATFHKHYFVICQYVVPKNMPRVQTNLLH